MSRHVSNLECPRYIYILDVIMRRGKSKFYGHSRIYYPGETNNLTARLRQHLYGINSHFLNHNFRDAQKIVVYVEHLWGSEADAMHREREIKHLSRHDKLLLIQSEKNDLIKYVPLQGLILKHPDDKTQQYYLPLHPPRTPLSFDAETGTPD